MVINVVISIGTIIHLQIKEDMFEFLCSGGNDTEASSLYCSRSSCTLRSGDSIKIDSSIEETLSQLLTVYCLNLGNRKKN